VVPLYGTKERGQRYVVGSGVLLQVGGESFLASAAHVFDENRRQDDPTNIEIPGRQQLIPLPGQVMTTPLPPSGRRADDPIDVAVVHLSADLVAELAYFKFVDMSEVDPSDRPNTHTLYTFAGYPSSKHEGPRDGVLTIEPVRYTSGPLFPEKYPSGFQLETHAGIDFNAKRMVARTERVQTPPDPHGVSGGGVFRLGTWEEIVAGTNQERLVGIGIEVRRAEHSLLGTRIAYALEMIRSYHPTLSDYLPRSEYLRVDVTHGSH
jgi:hypothetical protein